VRYVFAVFYEGLLDFGAAKQEGARPPVSTRAPYAVLDEGHLNKELHLFQLLSRSAGNLLA
jgi:hypothetical protein